MIIKGKYRIARRLGSQVFEKTQTASYARSEARKKSSSDSARSKSGKSDFGSQLLEKQKVRYTYGVGERQFAKYVKNILNKKGVKQEEKLYQTLEKRLDNVVYRLGLAKTHQAGRQMVSHGHIVVNGKKTTVPSYSVEIGDVISIRLGSQKSTLFQNLEERMKEVNIPMWLSFDISKKQATVVSLPTSDRTTLHFDLSPVLEFYKR